MRRPIIVGLLLVTLLATGCAGGITLSNKRFGSLPISSMTFVQPSQTKTYATLRDAWNALETGYQYATDNWYLSDNYGQAIPGGKDTWLMPSETQYLIDRYIPHVMDCEDGSAWLTSALKKQGYDAWFCVGSVTLDSGVYGHAWCMVLDNGAWTLYETTTGQTAEGLPNIYSLSWRTNGETTWRNPLVGSPMDLEPLPPDLLSELRTTLDG